VLLFGQEETMLNAKVPFSQHYINAILNFNINWHGENGVDINIFEINKASDITEWGKT